MNNLLLLEIMPGVYQTRVPGARVTLLLEGTLSLIDTGNRGSLPFITHAMRKLGRSVKELELVILTHYHPDHAGGLAEVVKASSPVVAVHENEAGAIGGLYPVPNPFRNPFIAHLAAPILYMMQSQPVMVNRLLRDGDELPTGGGARVVHAPGHTPGSICLYLPARKLLIVGDALRYRFRRLSLPPASVTWDIQMAQQSLKKLLALDFEAICFSHSGALLSNGHEALESLAKQLEAKKKI